MATTQSTTDPAVASREEHLHRFVAVANIVEPKHSYRDPWPITPDDVDFGYHQHRMGPWASCGPKNAFSARPIDYRIDTKSFNSWSLERQLAVITHELVHLSIGHNYDVAVHPPAFWNRMALYAQRVLDEFHTIESEWGVSLEPAVYRDAVINDPNDSTVDRRYETVDEVQRRLEQWVRWYTPDYRL